MDERTLDWLRGTNEEKVKHGLDFTRKMLKTELGIRTGAEEIDYIREKIEKEKAND